MTPDPLDDLAARGLLPPAGAGALALSWADGVDYRDRYRGCLLASAIGDALGRPAEGMPIEAVRERFGHHELGDGLRNFLPWRGWRSGPKGTITDDTQLTMCVAESLAAGGPLDPEDLARRLVDWLPHGRGKGAATTAAVEALGRGVSWWRAGEPSAGNGAAMRVAPVGLRYATDPAGLRRDAALSAVVTHADPMAVASAVAQAAGVAWCLHQPAGSLRPPEFVDAVLSSIADVHDPGHPERRPSAPAAAVRLAERIAELPGLLALAPDEAFRVLHNGAFVLESLPAAFWCFLRSPENAEEVPVTAANGGRDADTVAAMAGALVGAYLGESALPGRWRDDLEFAGDLVALAERLLSIAGADRRPGSRGR